PCCHRRHLRALGLGEGVVVLDLAVGEDEEVAGVVRVPVHHDVDGLAAVDDEVLGVLLGRGGGDAGEDVGAAAALGAGALGGAGHVGATPGAPETVHAGRVGGRGTAGRYQVPPSRARPSAPSAPPFIPSPLPGG